jgi:hypothetical protein
MVSVHVVAAHKDAIIIRIRNDTARDVVMLSPESPNRQVDEKRCTVRLSTKVDDRVRPFAFTPHLITVRRGTQLEVRAPLHPYELRTTRQKWLVTVEYAYVRPEDVERFAGKTTEDVREDVLHDQKTITTTVSVEISV